MHHHWCARQAGKLRYIGFTGHKDPRIHLQMLEVAAAEQVAVEYAKQHRLPLGATMTITDIHGRPQHFEVERSTLSNSLKDGGELKITRGAPALQGSL